MKALLRLALILSLLLLSMQPMEAQSHDEPQAEAIVEIGITMNETAIQSEHWILVTWNNTNDIEHISRNR